MIRPIWTLLAVVGVTLYLLFWLRATWHAPGEPLQVSASQNAELLQLTGTTARLAGEDYLRTAVAYSQTIYAAAQDKDRPGAVVLVRDDDAATAMATTRLQHFPVNAPMLFVTEGGTALPRETRVELERLGPEGVMMDHNVQVYLAGDIDRAVEREVQVLGMKTRRLYARNAVRFAEVLDEFIAVMEGNHEDMVIVAHPDALPFAYAASNWNAHMGAGWAFVTRDGVPAETRRMLERRAPNYPYIYVFAPPAVVSHEVMAELTRYGHVQRIPGATPQEMAVRWAGYKDRGRLLGWWFGKRVRDAGWGYAEPGHNVLLAHPDDWRVIVPSGVLSHMGKHAMLLLTDADGDLPAVVRDYLLVLKPTPTHPSHQLFNFAWILGRQPPVATQRELDELLSVAELQQPHGGRSLLKGEART